MDNVKKEVVSFNTTNDEGEVVLSLQVSINMIPKKVAGTDQIKSSLEEVYEDLYYMLVNMQESS